MSINTASLGGFLWNGIYNFPVKPGYRIFHWDGRQLRSFWREGSYWTLPPQTTPETKKCISFPTPTYSNYDNMLWPEMNYENVQISLTGISGVWTGGPRPIIRPMHIFAGATLQVDTFSKHFEIESVSWSLDDRDWHPMRKVWSGLWEQWEADFHPEEYRNGEYLCRVRAEVKGGSNAEFTDSVPVIVCPRNAPRCISPVVAGNLQTYQTFHFPFD